MHSLPDMNELAKIAASPAGQKILAIVQHSNDLDLDKITRDLKSGNIAAAQKELSAILANTDIQRLLKQLEIPHE